MAVATAKSPMPTATRRTGKAQSSTMDSPTTTESSFTVSSLWERADCELGMEV